MQTQTADTNPSFEPLIGSLGTKGGTATAEIRQSIEIRNEKTATVGIRSQESALIARVCGGDNEAYYELIKPYTRSLYFAAFSVLNNQADAEDCVQEAVLKAFKALKSFRAESKFSTWLIQIVVNEARLRLRKDRRHLYESLDAQPDTEEDYTPRDFADWREIPSETLARNELRRALANALASLKPKYREVFVLRDINRSNIQETAKALGISEASVKTRLLRARLQLREALAPILGESGTSCGTERWQPGTRKNIFA